MSNAPSKFAIERPVARPVTFRLPPNKEADPWFGGSRTFWNQRILRSKANGQKPPVESVVVKQPGAKRGIRFIVFESACGYFERLAQEQTPARRAA